MNGATQRLFIEATKILRFDVQEALQRIADCAKADLADQNSSQRALEAISERPSNVREDSQLGIAASLQQWTAQWMISKPSGLEPNSMEP